MSSRLTKIILENFESIEGRHELELGAINILVGPNSSGKSSIFDALTLFSRCLIPQSTHTFIQIAGKKYPKLVKNEISNESSNSNTRFLRNGAEKATIGLEFDLNSNSVEYKKNISPMSGGAYDLIAEEKLTTSGLNYKITFLLNFRKEKNTNWFIDEFNLLFLNEKFLEFKLENGIQNFKIYPNKNTIFDFFKEKLRVFSGPNYKCALNTPYYSFQPLIQNNFSNTEFPDQKDFLSTFFSIINVCLEQTYNKLALDYGPSWVPASREIPKPEECVFLVDEIDGYYADFINEIPIQNLNKSRHFKFIAESFAIKNYYESGQEYINNQVFFNCPCLDKNYGSSIYYSIKARSEIRKDKDFNGVDLSEDIKYCPLCGKKVELDQSNSVGYPFFDNEDREWEVSHADRINYYLANDLLVDNGYQIAADVDYIVNDYQLYNDDIFDTKPVIPIVRLYIKNAKGERLELEDVGSGVSYMLPVLAAACVRDGLVMIQQPELHIHPALQSAFANVFTDNYENPYFSNDEDRKNSNFSNIQFLIETHSEHLILRFLKLIKDSKKRTDSYRQLKSDDVSIFYFEPNPIKNSTLIKKIRITDDGGFLDRWPNGFFTERFKDIFDE